MLKMHRTQQNTSLSTIAAAALIGGLAGAVVGLMLAPKSGKALRQGLHEKADNVVEHAEDFTFHRAEVLKQQGTDLVDKGKKLAEDLQTFIQESIRSKKPDYIPTNITNSTQTNESLQTKPEINPQVLVQTESALEEE